MGKVGLSFNKTFNKSYGNLKNVKERDKANDALVAFQSKGSAAPHFGYIKGIDKKLKAKGLVLGRLTPPTAANAAGALRILLREDKKDAFYTALDIQPHENCYRDWQRNYSKFLP